MNMQVAQVRTDGGTQPRLQLDMAIIADYAEAMADGAAFPPITVFYDGSDYWLADGFHRLSAAVQLGLADIAADIRQGTLQDAQWHSYSVNQSHGLRRTNPDKRRAVDAALNHSYSSRYSNREIARHCGVSSTFVDNMRNEVSANGLQIDSRLVARNGSTYEMNTANIGQRPAEPIPFDLEAEIEEEKLSNHERSIAVAHIERQAADLGLKLIPQSPADHQLLNQSKSNEWYTPREYVDAARELMGDIDVDPASNDQANEWIGATTYYTKDTNGLDKPWRGRVWINPPYGKEDGDSNQERWTARLIEQFKTGITTEAVCLVNAVPGNLWFAPLWEFPICFVARRIRFYDPSGELGQPTHSNVLVYLGPQIARFVRIFSQFGPVAAQLSDYDDHVFIRCIEEKAA